MHVLLAQLQRVFVVGALARLGTGTVLGSGTLLLEQPLLVLRRFASSCDLAVLFLQLQCDIRRGTLARFGADASSSAASYFLKGALLVLAAQGRS